MSRTDPPIYLDVKVCSPNVVRTRNVLWVGRPSARRVHRGFVGFIVDDVTKDPGSRSCDRVTMS